MTRSAALLTVPEPCGDTTGAVTTASIAPADDPLTVRNRATWTAGDFERIAVGFAPGASEFVERVGVAIGDTVLDVATGTGNLAIPAARRGAVVTGLDIAPNLLATARAHAAALGLEIDFDEGNAECLPYRNGQFKTVVSMFGVMFAPRPERVARELLRVTGSGGRIALANWTPDGFIGKMLRLHAARVPPPPGVPSPLLWGDEERVRALFSPYAGEIKSLRFTPRTIALQYPTTPAGVIELFRTYYGPSVRTFAALDQAGSTSLAQELTSLWASHNTGIGNTTRVEAEYVEVLVERR